MTETKVRDLRIEVRYPADATVVGEVPNEVPEPVAATARELRLLYSSRRLDRPTASKGFRHAGIG
ncbi:hypothetical protein [Mycobacterium sp.]|jgi:hypothetical protein|uniref:hypothetical protein n=1 Tax=Mycobacterium sp. TaxID=1785 RepID=UPI00333EC23A|nr:hypothetical protein [Mycobacterium sp.]